MRGETVIKVINCAQGHHGASSGGLMAHHYSCRTSLSILQVVLCFLLFSNLPLALARPQQPYSPVDSGTIETDDNRLSDYKKLKAMVQFVNNQNSCSDTEDKSLIAKYSILKRIVNNASLDRSFDVVGQKSFTYASYLLAMVGDSQLRSDAAKMTQILKTIVQIHASSIVRVIVCQGSQLFTSDSTSVGRCITEGVFDSTARPQLIDAYWSEVVCKPEITVRKTFPLIQNKQTTAYVAFDFLFSQYTLDQCKADLHLCIPETTRCVYHKFSDLHFQLGNYKCECKKNYYLSTPGVNWFEGNNIERVYVENTSLYHRQNCLPCLPGCHDCNNSSPCLVEYEMKVVRGLPLAVQSFCITVCLVVAGIIFRIRRTRVIKTSNWILLEIFLLGAIFLYSTIVIMYFPPDTSFCLLLPWLREFGFAVTYGTLLVKIYRVLSGFQSRKAHRVHVRDKDLLKYLGGFILLASGYMAAWTATNFDHHWGPSNSSLLEKGELSQYTVTPTGPRMQLLYFLVCRAKFWDIVVEIIEFIILCLGIYYCHCVRSAPSEYNELRFITIALINETVVSAILHIVRHFVWYSLHPDYVYLMYFFRCHATVTVTVVLIIGPKFWYLHRPPGGQGRNRGPGDHVGAPNKLHLASNGDIDIGEVNLADMDAEDIRRELKRLYTQVEIYKTKAMRRDNPHVSKRRGGRKQRRFSLQPFYKKHHASSNLHEEEVSKLSEESTNSGEEGATATQGNTTATSTKTV